MSATRSTRRHLPAGSTRGLVGAVAATAAVLLLAGCGSGQVGTIGSQVAAVNGAQGEAGPLSLRNVTMAYPTTGDSYPTGSTVPLLFTITNSAVTSDELTGVTTPAGTVQLEGNAAVAGQSSLVSAARQRNDGTSATAVPYSETPGTLRARLTGTTEVIRPGLTVPMTFTFSRSGSVTVPVPVAYPDTERSDTSEG